MQKEKHTDIVSWINFLYLQCVQYEFKPLYLHHCTLHLSYSHPKNRCSFRNWIEEPKEYGGDGGDEEGVARVVGAELRRKVRWLHAVPKGSRDSGAWKQFDLEVRMQGKDIYDIIELVDHGVGNVLYIQWLARA